MLTREKIFHTGFVMVFVGFIQGLMGFQLVNAQQPSGADVSKKVQQAFERIVSKPPPFRLPFTVVEGDWNTLDLKQGNVANTFSNDPRFMLYSHWQIDRYLKEGIAKETSDLYRVLFDGALKNEFDGWSQTVGYEGGVFSGAYPRSIELPGPFLEILMLQTASPALKGFSPWNVDDVAEVYVDEWLFGITVNQFRKLRSLIGEAVKDFSLFIDSNQSDSTIFFINVNMPSKRITLSANLVRAIFLSACFNYLSEQTVAWTKDMPKPNLANEFGRSMSRVWDTPSQKFDRLRYADVDYGSFANGAAKAVNQYLAIITVVMGQELFDAADRLREILPEESAKCKPKGKELVKIVYQELDETTAHEIIKQWSLPETGKFWSKDQTPSRLLQFENTLSTLAKSCIPIS